MNLLVMRKKDGRFPTGELDTSPRTGCAAVFEVDAMMVGLTRFPFLKQNKDPDLGSYISIPFSQIVYSPSGNRALLVPRNRSREEYAPKIPPAFYLLDGLNPPQSSSDPWIPTIHRLVLPRLIFPELTENNAVVHGVFYSEDILYLVSRNHFASDKVYDNKRLTDKLKGEPNYRFSEPHEKLLDPKEKILPLGNRDRARIIRIQGFSPTDLYANTTQPDGITHSIHFDKEPHARLYPKWVQYYDLFSPIRRSKRVFALGTTPPTGMMWIKHTKPLGIAGSAWSTSL